MEIYVIDKSNEICLKSIADRTSTKCKICDKVIYLRKYLNQTSNKLDSIPKMDENTKWVVQHQNTIELYMLFVVYYYYL